MLENGEYSSWVKAIFLGIKGAAKLRAVKMFNWISNYVVNEFLMNNPKVFLSAYVFGDADSSPLGAHEDGRALELLYAKSGQKVAEVSGKSRLVEQNIAK